jgi:sRNA-binding protein
MKKTIAVVVALLFLLGFTSFTFAQEKKHRTTKATQENIEIIRGKVVSVDQANKQIVVKDNKTQADRSFAVSKKAIAVVKVGDEVKVKVKVGSAQAESVKIVKSETKKKQ